jgi:ketosteroid isomerase-like protein
MFGPLSDETAARYGCPITVLQGEMRRIVTRIAATALFLAVPPAAAKAGGGDVAQIEALEARFAAAVKAKDVDAIMGFYVPTRRLVVFDVAPPRQYIGAAAYRKNWEGFFATVKGLPKFTISDLFVAADRNLAYSHSIQHVSGTDTRGKAFDLTVRVTEVYRRIGGVWLIEHEHVSVPVSLETDKPDLASKP